MTNLASELVASIEQLSAGRVDAEYVNVIAAAIQCDQGKAVFEKFIDELMVRNACKANAVALAMRILDQTMDVDSGVAGYLMARLYPVAARQRAHEVCNAIDLWMANVLSPSLVINLSKLQTEGVAPKFHRRIANWLLGNCK